jgi:hypothetical protein
MAAIITATLITPRELLDTSIGQLRTLAAFLEDQLGDGGIAGVSRSPEFRACDEVRRSLNALIPKLRAVRRVTPRGEGIECWEERTATQGDYEVVV